MTQSLNLAQQLARPELLTLEPYQSARRIGGEGQYWINANESPFDNVSLFNELLSEINRYPECQPPELLQAYAKYAAIKPEQLLSCRGADEAIELLIRTFCIPAIDSITCFGPTYGMYAISAQAFNVKVNALDLTDDYLLPMELKTQVADSKLVFICNPNNPTGTIIDKANIEKVLKQLPDRLVIVDEAYIEFCPDYSVIELVENYENLVVLRTLSKAFALAGARCGFMAANPNIIDMVMRVIAPYPVPRPVSQLACQALSTKGIALMQQQVVQLKQNGLRLAEALEQSGAKLLPAYGNFILASFTDVTAMQIKLKQAGVVARTYNNPRLANCIRFSFTNDKQTDGLLKLLKN